jgi:hypothetical protein
VVHRNFESRIIYTTHTWLSKLPPWVYWGISNSWNLLIKCPHGHIYFSVSLRSLLESDWAIVRGSESFSSASHRQANFSLDTLQKKKLLFGVCLQRLDYKHSLISPTYRKHLRYFNQGSLLSKASQLGKDRNGHMAQTAALIFCERKESYKPAACWVLGNYSYTALVCSRVN